MIRHAIYSDQYPTKFKYAILVESIDKDKIKKEYIEISGIDPADVIVLNLYQDTTKKKTPATVLDEYLKTVIQPIFNDYFVEYVIVADPDYYKRLTGSKQADKDLGYIKDSILGSQQVVYVPNLKRLFYDPDKIRAMVQQGLTALSSKEDGTYTPPGSSIIKKAVYPHTYEEIRSWLKTLHKYPKLSVDIEGFGLKHYTCGIGSITFCWNEGEGISFPVDLQPQGRIDNQPVKDLLREFFKSYQGKTVYHNAGFDIYVMVYELFMESIIDNEGMLQGIEVLMKNFDDTMLITYLATNSCAGNILGLKHQASEFAGNYAIEEIKNILLVEIEKLLEYNLIDGLSTHYVYNKHWPTIIQDNQEEIYEGLFKDALRDIVQMQLTGLPVNMETVKLKKAKLEKDERDSLNKILHNPVITEFNSIRATAWAVKRNQELKVKRVTEADAPLDKRTFNPGSADQVQYVLYEMLELPVLDTTDSGKPSTDSDTLEKLKNHTTTPEAAQILEGLLEYKAVSIILSTFIPAFENAQKGPDGWHYLFGYFNLGGTKSGRLSSKQPNLQNIPATGSQYAKDIKECVEPPPGWIFCGLDFDSLEDKISALTTRDPNKLKVYTDGFDGHCLRAYSYFGDQITGIDGNSVSSINSMKKSYPELRQLSKAPTFALTYQGTYKTLMVNCGFTEEQAKSIESKYHELYTVSDQWVADKLEKATQTGFVELAFGLRLRTPLLKQVVLGTRKTPHEAAAEGRTAGNALGQSWCLLNSRAASEFMKAVRSSQYRNDIRICAQIHDAQYYLVKDDVGALEYLNTHLPKAVSWQEDPAIAHDTVKLSGAVDIFHPTWAKSIGLKPYASSSEIVQTVQDYLERENAK